jgi:hypothetical protein
LAYQGGIGEVGVDALKMFVQAGGRLITFDAASDLPLESFGGVFAHIKNTVSPLARTTFYCPGRCCDSTWTSRTRLRSGCRRARPRTLRAPRL